MRAWTTLDSRVLLDRPPWLTVYSEQVQLPDGRVVPDYLRLKTPDFVVIVPVRASGEIGLIHSYKRGPDRIDQYPPAGMIEAGEAPQAAAERELLEELGCRAGRWTPLGQFVLAGNMRGADVHVFIAHDCQSVTEPDSGDLEEQQIEWADLARVRAMWTSGEFAQLGSVAAIGLAMAHLESNAE